MVEGGDVDVGLRPLLASASLIARRRAPRASRARLATVSVLALTATSIVLIDVYMLLSVAAAR